MINVELSFKILRLTFCHLTYSRWHPKWLPDYYMSDTICFSHSIKWLLKQVIFLNNLRPKKNICVFQISGWNKLGMVGQNNILFCQNILFSRCQNCEAVRKTTWDIDYDQYCNTTDRYDMYEVHINKTLRVGTCFVFIFEKRRDRSRQGSVLI